MTRTQSTTYSTILKTSGELLSQRGYYGVSMSDIADKVGITKAALYYHFTSKDDLVKVLMEQTVAELKSDLRKVIENSRIPSDLLFGVVETMLAFKINHPEITMFSSQFLSTDEKIPIMEFLTDLRKEFLVFLRELISDLNFVRKGSLALIFSLLTTLIGIILVPFHPEDKNPNQLAKDFIGLIEAADK